METKFLMRCNFEAIMSSINATKNGLKESSSAKFNMRRIRRRYRRMLELLVIDTGFKILNDERDEIVEMSGGFEYRDQKNEEKVLDGRGKPHTV